MKYVINGTLRVVKYVYNFKSIYIPSIEPIEPINTIKPIDP